MDHGSRTFAPTPSNEPEARAVSSDPGPLSRGAVGPIPDVFERCGRNSLTRAVGGQSAQNRETLETRGVRRFRGSSMRSLAVDADASFDALVLDKRRLHLASLNREGHKPRVWRSNDWREWLELIYATTSLTRPAFVLPMLMTMSTETVTPSMNCHCRRA